MISAATLGRSGLTTTNLAFGTSPLANMGIYGYDVDEQRAVDTVEAAFGSAVRFVDTSNGYGADGVAEKRIGLAIRDRGGLPDDYLLATKVDPRSGSKDFSGERVLESYRESLDRLGVDRVPLLHLHDPERIGFDAAMAPGGPVEALRRLKESGAVDSIGVAGGPVDLLRRLVATDVFDVVLTHNRFTLLDRSAATLIAEAATAGIGVINAAPYGGGMLSRGPDLVEKYAYSDNPIARDRARLMQDACGRHGVPLIVAALQFSTRHPSIDATVVGVSAPQRVAETIELTQVDVPGELWAELDAIASEGPELRMPT